MTTYEGDTPDARDMLARRPQGWRQVWDRYVLGKPTEVLLTREELAGDLGWRTDEEVENTRRIDLMQKRLDGNIDGLREQFGKIAVVIQLLAFMIAGYALNGGVRGVVIVALSIAAAISVWTQSPRLKIFQFRHRPDAGVEIGKIKNHFDHYYYLYVWNGRREETLHAGEVLVVQATACAILTLIVVAIASVV